MNFTTPGFTLHRNDCRPICKNQPFPLFLKGRRGTLCLLCSSFSLSCLPGRRYLNTPSMSFGTTLFVGYPLKRTEASGFFSFGCLFSRRFSLALHHRFALLLPPPLFFSLLSKLQTGTLTRARCVHMIHTCNLPTALPLRSLRTCRSNQPPRYD